jgi:tartrate/fumarate subfamily iron-sulfur-dependent hydro-lyase beta chain
MLTGRDAAHKRIQDMLAKGEKLPVDFTNRVIYYVGPVDPVRDEVVGPAGPTTATRMDKFTEMMLAQTGLISMIGKAERGPVAIEAIRKHKSAYLMAVGGAAYLVAKAIKGAKVVGFADLGMEAIYEFDVSRHAGDGGGRRQGTSVHITGPKEWQAAECRRPTAQSAGPPAAARARVALAAILRTLRCMLSARSRRCLDRGRQPQHHQQHRHRAERAFDQAAQRHRRAADLPADRLRPRPAAPAVQAGGPQHRGDPHAPAQGALQRPHQGRRGERRMQHPHRHANHRQADQHRHGDL